MGKVTTGFSMSLDGFVAQPNDDVGPLFDWYFNGDTNYTAPSGKMEFKLGAGIRLFDHLAAAPLALASTNVVAAPGVTHLTFRVVK